MKITELFDIDKFIKVNDIKEVTSQTIYTSQNVFNPHGLFSEEIFGQLPEERNFKCGYISLPIHVFNPDIAKTIISMSGGIIRKMAYGEVKCDIVDGVLTETIDGKYCGLVDLYNIWDNIDIKKTLTTSKTEKITILVKSPKNLIFNNKVLVLPPNLRKIGTLNGRSVKSKLNTLYLQILGQKSVTSHITSNVYQGYNKMQDAVIDLYSYIKDYVSAKDGFFQKHLMSKTTARTVRNVISAPHYNTNTPEIGIFRTGYPLASLCSMFKPMIVFHMKQFLSYDNISNIHPNKNEVKSSNIENMYDDRAINDLLNIFIMNQSHRFKKLYLDPNETTPILFEAFNVTKNEKISRPLTLTDVIYICTQNAVVDADRMVYTVRYPIGDYLGAFFTKVHVLSTVYTMHVQYMGYDYKSYPIIDPELSSSIVATSFATTINLSNSRLKALGGDYDGDTVKSSGIWSDEANKQAETLMYSKIYNITPQCTTIYEIAIECLNGLYSLTKDT